MAKTKPIKWAELFENMSQNVLCDELSEGWQDMDEDELYEMLELNAWQPIENMAGADIYENILNATDSLASMLIEHGVKIDFGSDKHPNRSHIPM